MSKSFPSIYANRPHSQPPVWSLIGGVHNVLQPADGVRGSCVLAAINLSASGTFYTATVTVPGTTDAPGSFDVIVGRHFSLEQARAFAEQAVALRHADPISFDKAAHKAARKAERAGEPLILSDFRIAA